MDTELVTCATAGCGHSPFPMSSGFIDRARETHEWFSCPAGHGLSFHGESTTETAARRLKAAKTSRDYWKNRADRLERTGPWNGCESPVFVSVQGLQSHMRQIHQMPSWAALGAMDADRSML